MRSGDRKGGFRFYLGTHVVSWLWRFPDVEFFVSDTQLRARKSLYPALSTWALDSGGFSELTRFGRWTVTAHEYANRIKRYSTEIGKLRWAAPQDWMCEPGIREKTGLSVEQHQENTIDSVLLLRELCPGEKVIPVLQGWSPADYFRHRDRYYERGIDLGLEQVVGMGSVCRRQSVITISSTIAALSCDINLHAFGFKKTGLRQSIDHLTSADSMAWSLNARNKPALAECSDKNHKNCANCFVFAKRWLDELREEFQLCERLRSSSLVA